MMVLGLKPEILLAVMLVPILFFLTKPTVFQVNCHLQGDTSTAGSGFGTDNQYPTTEHHGEGHHHKHYLGGTHTSSQDSEVTGTGTGVKPSMTDKIIGGLEKATGKMTSNTGMYERGEERVVS